MAGAVTLRRIVRSVFDSLGRRGFTSEPGSSAARGAEVLREVGGQLSFLRMPQLSHSMAEGRVVRWHAAEGEEVPENGLACDVATDSIVPEGEKVGEWAGTTVLELELTDGGHVAWRRGGGGGSGAAASMPPGECIMVLSDCPKTAARGEGRPRAAPEGAGRAWPRAGVTPGKLRGAPLTLRTSPPPARLAVVAASREEDLDAHVQRMAAGVEVGNERDAVWQAYLKGKG